MYISQQKEKCVQYLSKFLKERQFKRKYVIFISTCSVNTSLHILQKNVSIFENTVYFHENKFSQKGFISAIFSPIMPKAVFAFKFFLTQWKVKVPFINPGRQKYTKMNRLAYIPGINRSNITRTDSHENAVILLIFIIK